MAETCKSCGKAWTEHLGVEPTCALLQEAVKILKEIGEPQDLSEYGQNCYYCKKSHPSEEHDKDCVVYLKDKFLEKVEAYLKME